MTEVGLSTQEDSILLAFMDRFGETGAVFGLAAHAPHKLNLGLRLCDQTAKLPQDTLRVETLHIVQVEPSGMPN